jgi:hypothetical protein
MNLISMPTSMSSSTEPELYELEIQQPSMREDWITGIRDAVDACAFDEGQMVSIYRQKFEIRIFRQSFVFYIPARRLRVSMNVSIQRDTAQRSPKKNESAPYERN